VTLTACFLELSGQCSIPVTQLDEPLASRHGVQIHAARLDLLDPVISGNKWFKLQHNLRRAQQGGLQHILSFGGPWSNHIHALAYAGQRFGFATTGVIRGYAHLPLTATLRDAQAWGMQLHFVGHQEYARKTQAAWLEQLQRRFGPCLIVPEGGNNAAGIAGCAQIMGALDTQVDMSTAVLAVGAGATLAGLQQQPGGLQKILGVSVLKGDKRDFSQGLHAPHCTVDVDHHFGGYARTEPRLLRFIEWFYRRHGIVLEPVYTGKMFYALYQRLRSGWFAPGEQVVALHSGGLQGLRGFVANWPWAVERLAHPLD
jgi:1-aminocyclopropane-1-carboxylate deaminase